MKGFLLLMWASVWLLAVPACSFKIKGTNSSVVSMLVDGRLKNGRIRFVQKKYLERLNANGGKSYVSIDIPLASNSGTISENINRALLTAISIGPVDESGSLRSYKELINNFFDSYRKFVKNFPDYKIGWEWTVKGEVEYVSSQILNIRIDSYSFTGGAHGNSQTSSLIFDPVTGEQLEYRDLLKDSVSFQNFAEGRFREKYHIPSGEPINSTGFMFMNDRFALPENVFFTKEGILLYYNDLEIASHVNGPQELFIPYDDAMKYLKRNPLL